MKRQRLVNKFEEICSLYLNTIKKECPILFLTPWGELLQLPNTEFILFDYENKEAYYLRSNRDLVTQIIGEMEFQILHLQRTYDRFQARKYVALKYELLEKYCPYTIKSWRTEFKK